MRTRALHDRRPTAPLAALLLLCPLPAQEKPQEKPPSPAAVKAAFILKFAAYVRREPEPAPQPGPEPGSRRDDRVVRIGIVGTDATAAFAQKLLPGKTVGDRKVEVVTLTVEQALGGAGHCHLLYIGSPIDA